METHHGLLVLDKAPGLTSRAVVNRAQQWFPPGTRIGHTGTLDPLATGVLVLCVGAATKLTEYVQDMDKVYRAGIVLGATSTTDDAEGAVTSSANVQPVPEEFIRRELATFLGDVEQVPPAFSAAKVAGRRAYELARKGKEVSLAARTVRIYGIEVLRYEFPKLEVEIRCGKGTYIRSLARDLGQRLGCGGLIASLRRLRVGPFTTEQAVALDAEPTAVQKNLLPLAMAVSRLPAAHLSEMQVRQLRQGQTILWSELGESVEMAAFDGAGHLVGVVSCGQGRLQAVRMLFLGD